MATIDLSKPVFIFTKKELQKNSTKNFHIKASRTMVMTCLCVGPKNSGKTMLMSSIQYPGSVNFTTHSVNTVGTNIYTVNFTPVATENKPVRKNQKRSVTVRELGGEMAVMWKNYYAETVERVIFVVDTSNLCQISCAGEWKF
jgi:ADP-ribosylation factor-like protein 1